MRCSEVKPLLSSFMDNAMTGKELHAVAEHVEQCEACRCELAALSTAQKLLSSLGPAKAHPKLALRLHAAVAEELARTRETRFGLPVYWRERCKLWMVPATAAIVTTVVAFGLLIEMLVPAPMRKANDVAINLYTPPVLAASPFVYSMGAGNADSVLVEAYVDANGRVQDYRILSAPEDAGEFLSELKNILIFTVFRPATRFGQPTTGRVILSFSKINVKG